MSNDTNDNQNPPKNRKKLNKFLKFTIILVCILVFLSLAWIVFSLIGRVNAVSVIPGSAQFRVSISNPVQLLDGILSHESLQNISNVPALAELPPVIDMLKENPVLKNRLVRLAARGNFEFAVLPVNNSSGIIAAWDMGLASPLLRILPVVSNFAGIRNLYYVQAGKNSRFEYRMGEMTLYVGSYRNLLVITDNSATYEARSFLAGENPAEKFSIIKTSSYDAAVMVSGEFISGFLADQDSGIAKVLDNINFDSKVEAGVSVHPKKIEFRLTAPLSSHQAALNNLLQQRSQPPGMAERIPADTQYATIISAGTLNDLYQAAFIFTPGLDDAMRTAERLSRTVLGLSVNDLLFSWTGNEFAVFGIEGRPHPVYAVQIADERKRSEVFDKAFRSVVLSEDTRLNLDGMRIPRIETPDFLQSLLRRWNIFLPSPYYIVYKDFFLASESAEALLSSLRAMQRNDILPKTAAWRNIAGGKTTASSVSLYYSLDLSVPFFLRSNTVLSAFLSLYRQGLVRLGFDRGAVDISLSLIPGSGNGVTLASGYPIDVGAFSNRLCGTGSGDNSWIFFSSGNSAMSFNIANNVLNVLPNQGNHWIIPAEGIGEKGAINAWIVTDRGRVTLVDTQMETAQGGFPVLTGHRLSSAPKAFEGKLYLCDEDGKVHVIDEEGNQDIWETAFTAAVRSAPSFLTVTARRNTNSYAAVYPKSFIGEIWLLDINGKAFPKWPAPISVSGEEDGAGFGIGFGSPLLFAHNNRVHVAFVNQSGQLLVYDENAVLVPPFPLNLEGVFYIQPVFDGEYLWLVSSDGTFFRVSLDGEILFQRINNFSVKEEGCLTFFDCDGDKIPEVFMTGEGNALHGYTRGFRSLEDFPLPVWGTPYFIPGQGSKKAEVFGIGMDRRLYRWQFK